MNRKRRKGRFWGNVFSHYYVLDIGRLLYTEQFYHIVSCHILFSVRKTPNRREKDCCILPYKQGQHVEAKKYFTSNVLL